MGKTKRQEPKETKKWEKAEMAAKGGKKKCS